MDSPRLHITITCPQLPPLTSQLSTKQTKKPAMDNEWLPHSTLGNLDQDSAIRRFCPARTEQEHGAEWGEVLLDYQEMEAWPHFASEMAHLAPSEAEQIVDAFFNVECYEKDNAGKSSEEENEGFDPFHEDGLQNISMIEDIFCQSNDSTMIEDDTFVHVVSNAVDENVVTNGVDQGLELVHLLLACAEAVGCRDAQLAESILARVWPCVNPWGDSLQRVCHCFAMGLDSRLSLLHNVNPNGSFSNRASLDLPLITKEEKSEAFSLLHQTTPYLAFGFMAANDAICQAAKEKDLLHIIDLGMEHTLQWTSLLRVLSSKGPPKFRVIKITGIIGDDQDPLNLETSMSGIREEAISLGISFEFHLVKEEVSPLSLTREKLESGEEEALFVNSVMHLHKHVKESRGSLKTILQAIKKLRPVLLTVVEQDANHNGPFFLGRFLESLHYYSAIFDSLDASLPRNSPQRMKIERLHLAEEIRNVVAYEGSDRTERHERADQWRRQLGRAGFQVVGLKCLNQAKMVVSGYVSDGYTVASEKGCLQLGWKGRPIMLASAWQPH